MGPRSVPGSGAQLFKLLWNRSLTCDHYAKVYYVRPDQTIEDCMALMTAQHIRHLPVMVDERLVGLVSIGDIVKALIDDQAVRIQQLEGYITGSR